MPKLTHPYTKSFSHDGETYEADEAGLIDFPDHVVGVAIAHGFKHPTVEHAKAIDVLAQLAQLEGAHKDLGEQFTDALAKITTLEAANAELGEKLASSETSNVDLRNLVATTEAAKAELERELESTKAELAKTKKVK